MQLVVGTKVRDFEIVSLVKRGTSRYDCVVKCNKGNLHPLRRYKKDDVFNFKCGCLGDRGLPRGVKRRVATKRTNVKEKYKDLFKGSVVSYLSVDDLSQNSLFHVLNSDFSGRHLDMILSILTYMELPIKWDRASLFCNINGILQERPKNIRHDFLSMKFAVSVSDEHLQYGFLGQLVSDAQKRGAYSCVRYKGDTFYIRFLTSSSYRTVASYDSFGEAQEDLRIAFENGLRYVFILMLDYWLVSGTYFIGDWFEWLKYDKDLLRNLSYLRLTNKDVSDKDLIEMVLDSLDLKWAKEGDTIVLRRLRWNPTKQEGYAIFYRTATCTDGEKKGVEGKLRTVFREYLIENKKCT